MAWVAEPQSGPVRVSLESASAPEEPVTMLSGLVLDQVGQPLAGASVRLADGMAPVVAGEDGTFSIRGPEAGSIAVVSAPGHEATTQWLDAREPLRVALVTQPPWAEGDAEFAAPSGELLGEGFVVDAEGRAVRDAVVAIADTGLQARTDGSGRYRIALPEGPASVVAWKDATVARADGIEPARTRGLVPMPQLVLEPGATVRGRLVDEAGEPLEGATFSLRGEGVWRQFRSGEGGAFVCSGVGHGDYVLTVQAREGLLGMRRALAVAGSHVDLELTQKAAEPFAVEVFHGAEPVAGVWVMAEEPGLRRVVTQTDDSGRATLEGMGDGPFEFEVRAPENYARYAIVDFDSEKSRLLVQP